MAGSINPLSDSKSATPNGTPIVNPGADLDKNAFFKILAAELANLDPTAQQDTTAYITQLAQFTTMEQMSTLNNTMTLTAAQNLTGRFVALNVVDDAGVPMTGMVRSVYTYKGEVYVTVEGLDGKFTNYKYSQVTDVMDYSDPNMDNLAFANAANLIGKNVEITIPGEDPEKPEKINGKVLKVYRDSEGIKVKVEVTKDGVTEVKDYMFNSVTSVED